MQSPTYTWVFCEDIKIPAFVSHLPTVCNLIPFIIMNKPALILFSTPYTSR